MENPDLMVRCAQCGEMNRLPTIHCKKCGAKMDFRSAEQKILGQEPPTWGERLRGMFKVALILVLGVALLLAIWPGQMIREVGEAVDARRYRLKAELLVDSLDRGIPASQVITEMEINAFLREQVAAQPAPQGWSAVLEDMGARFGEGRAELFVSIARGPVTLTTHLWAVPQGGGLVVQRARIGHLPLPGILGRMYARTRTGSLLEPFRNEARILRHLDGVLVESGSIEILVKAAD